MKHFVSEKQLVGEKGEEICSAWLSAHGYKLLQRNFTVASGEIDIIARKTGVLHFIEVKSVSYETLGSFNPNDIYNPAQNVTHHKIQKCYRAILQYLKNNRVSHETKYQFDVYVVYIDANDAHHKIQRIENVLPS